MDIKGENINLLNLDPNEAQQLIIPQNLELHYGTKISSTIIETDLNKNNTQNTKMNSRTAETYKLKHRHGQDGLGGYFFAYSDWNQARMEARNKKGEVRGQYKYKIDDNTEYSINYWADNLGYHYEDNLPKINLVPVTEEPAVKAAREEHLKKWKEAAALAKKVYDPMSDYYNRFANQYDEQQALLEQEKEIFDENDSNLSIVKKFKSNSIESDRLSESAKGGFLAKHSYSVPVNILKLKEKF